MNELIKVIIVLNNIVWIKIGKMVEFVRMDLGNVSDIISSMIEIYWMVEIYYIKLIFNIWIFFY